MAVYVDDMRAPYGRMIMCHMIADSPKELHAMAYNIGVKRRYVQYEGRYDEHYDVSLGARAKAVKLGAKEITMRELGKMIRERRAIAITEYTVKQAIAKSLRELKESGS